MEKLAIALWKATTTSNELCRSTLLDVWSRDCRETDAVEHLTINLADIDQGAFTGGPDALLIIGRSEAHGLDDVPNRDTLHAIAQRLDIWRVITNEVLVDPDLVNCIKMVSLVQRAATITHAQFIRHWGEQHAPLALHHHVGLCGYLQHEVRKAYTPGGNGTDGIAELSFRTRADFDERMYDSDAGKTIIRDDVQRFITRRSMASLMTPYRVV